MWLSFKNQIHTSLENCVKKSQRINKSNKKPWINKEILDLTKRKKELWNIYIINKTEDSYRKFRNINHKIIKLSKYRRAQFETNVIDSGPKAFYGYIRRQLNSKVTIPNMLKTESQELVEEPHKIAELFADQFVNSYVREPDGPIPSINMPMVTNSIDDVKFTAKIVLKTLLTFDDATATGPDGIPSILLKRCSSLLAEYISSIMNKSMEDGRLPADWKKATVVPIYKNGDKMRPSNYRPISLTSILCKAMEKIITERLREFLLQEQLILDEQHGFVPKRSIITNMLQCVNEWVSNHDNGLPTDVIYLDYEKAFDRVPLRRLICKLKHFGIRGKLLAWISDFLSDRTFCVRVGSTMSKPREVLSGVPQGSVLGPLLFILYLSDLKSTLQLPFSLFADDTKFFGNPITQHQVIQQDLNAIYDWTSDWLLTLNADKCTVLHIGKNNPRNTYYLGDHPLSSVESQKDLGITITSDLKWETHILNIVKKANSMMYMIRKSFMCLTPKIFNKIYRTYLRPLLEFAYVIWDPYFRKDIIILENVQRRATKMVKQLRNMTYEQRMRKLNLTTLENRRQRGSLIETYKILTGYYNVPTLPNLYLLNSNKRLRGHQLKLCHRTAKRNPMKNFITNRVVTEWNKLPQNVIDAPTLNAFKNRLDKISKH